jgi:hypothetical protein
MSNVKDTFIIEWVGPFNNKEELRMWERKNNLNQEFKFYILTGKTKGKQKVCSYCGITEQEYVYRRYANHPKFSSINRELNIWIGKFTDPKLAIRSNLEMCETLLVSYWQCQLNNKKRKYYPATSLLIINRWFSLNLKPRVKRLYPVQSLSDVILYDCDDGEIWISEQLKKY